MPDRFDAMHAFVAVCEAQGFSPAARKLELSPSVVTRLVAGLEERLGVRLLQRTTRSVRVTEAGLRYLERARRILAEVDEAETSAQGERAEPRGKLVVAAPLLFGRMHVAPLVSKLLDALTGLSAELQLSDRYVNLVEDGVDVAIRIGELADSTLVARRLGATRRVLVASPAYLERRGGPPLHPSDLADHALIAFLAVTPGREWAFLSVDGTLLTVAVEPRFSTNSGDAAIEHAIAGGGITAALSYQVAAPKEAGALVEVLPEFAPPAAPIQALFPSTRLLSAKVRAFLDLAQRAVRDWSF